VAGSVVVCGSGQRCTAPSLARSRRAPHKSSPRPARADHQRPDRPLGRVAPLHGPARSWTAPPAAPAAAAVRSSAPTPSTTARRPAPAATPAPCRPAPISAASPAAVPAAPGRHRHPGQPLGGAGGGPCPQHAQAHRDACSREVRGISDGPERVQGGERLSGAAGEASHRVQPAGQGAGPAPASRPWSTARTGAGHLAVHPVLVLFGRQFGNSRPWATAPRSRRCPRR
jgi:hypothetical protein